MTAFLQVLTTVMPFLPALAAVVAGLFAIRAIRREPIRSRKDRGLGIGLAVLIALGLGLYVAWFILFFFSFGTGPRPGALGPAAAYGAIAAGLVALSGLAGYALLARRASRVALLGSVLGPVLLVGVTIGISVAGAKLQSVAYEKQQQADAAAVAQHSEGLTLTVSDVTASLASDGVAIGVAHLRATIHADRDLTFQSGSKEGNPRFQFLVPNASMGDLTAGANSPTSLSKGADSTWDLTYTVSPELLSSYGGTFGPPAGAGEWTLHVDFLDAAGAEYILNTTVAVAATP